MASSILALRISVSINPYSSEGVIPPSVLESNEIVTKYTMDAEKAATKMIAQFKAKLKSDVLSCRILTTAYPLLIDHILREANHYINLLDSYSNIKDI